MRTWRTLEDERLVLYSPIGLRLVDDFTGGGPLGRVRAYLDIQDGGSWRETPFQPIFTPSGVLTYPGLGRDRDPAGSPRRYRIRLECPLYRPDYLAAADGIEFDAHPYDDRSPPTAHPSFPQGVALLPAVTYAFEPYVSVIRGLVRDTAGDAVENAVVQEGMRERVLTDDRGAFALPLRWVPEGTPTVVDATDQRTLRAGSINVTLPGALSGGQTITIS